jgi:hypothetical protein
MPIELESDAVRMGAPAIAQTLRLRQLPSRSLSAAGKSSLETLPFPNPGDRIRADDIKALSSSLLLIRDAFALSGALFGQTFGQAKLVLGAQGYQVRQVMTVFGTQIENMEDESLDNRKVIQAIPVELGIRDVAVILTEAVETRRFAPNLLGLTYEAASERLQGVLGDVTYPSTPVTASQLVGLTLAEAKKTSTQ